MSEISQVMDRLSGLAARQVPVMQIEKSPAGISPAPFQIEDMSQLEKLSWSANWSEMGCYKTSTVLWMIPKWAAQLNKDVKDLKVLIITTRSGKGTYFKHIPDLCPELDMFNLLTTKCNYRLMDQEFDVGYNSKYDGGGIWVGHYNVLSRRKKKKKKDPEVPEEVEEITDAIDLLEQELLEAALEEEAINEIRSEISDEERMLQDILGDILNPQPKVKESTKRVPLIDELLRTKWDVIILDEAHRIKERTTGWTKEIKRLKSRIKHFMTGTGFINDPSEVWSLLNFGSKDEYTSYWKFREYFCAEDVVNGFRKIVGIHPDHKEEFIELIRSLGPRRTKKEVFKNLPDPIYTPYSVELNAIQRRMYDEIRDELMALDEAGEALYAPNVLVALGRLRQICVSTPRVYMDYYDPITKKRVQKWKWEEPSSKLDCLMDIIDGLSWDRERRDQVVVFSNFKDPLEMLKIRLAEKIGIDGRIVKPAIPYIELRQQDNDDQRYQKWAIEFPKKKHQVFMSTIALGSESISLTSATTCVFLDRSWSPKDNSQAESRVWRPGQEEVCNIIHINAEYTVDSRVLQSNNIKQGWFKEIFG